MSQRNKEKRRQLRTAPCGRPLVVVVLDEEAEPTQTTKLRFLMKDFIMDTSFWGNPIFASLAERIWWFTLLYSPSKSRKATTRILFCDRDSFIAIANKIKASVMEWCFLKPYLSMRYHIILLNKPKEWILNHFLHYFSQHRSNHYSPRRLRVIFGFIIL
jgi:hypothetical protein